MQNTQGQHAKSTINRANNINLGHIDFLYNKTENQALNADNNILTYQTCNYQNQTKLTLNFQIRP